MVEKSDNFQNAKRYSWVITAGEYGNLRKQDFEGFDDIETIDDDRKCMLEGI